MKIKCFVKLTTINGAKQESEIELDDLTLESMDEQVRLTEIAEIESQQPVEVTEYEQ